ncbi:MAG: metallophosphoesterase [Candidatus Dojkabacteria bacterium]|nr:metallophosphoesterase [Candidatus Dojkabacteria bacterium]
MGNLPTNSTYWLLIASIGEQGVQGIQGETGNGIVSVEKTAGTGMAGTTDTYTITFTDATITTFQVYNGADGLGAGDMLKSVYDTDNDGKVNAAENADTVNGKTVAENVPSGAVFTDTVTTINGKTGAIVKSDIVALGIPAEDTNTTYSPATTLVDGLMSSADKAKLNGIESNANNYVHPATHSADIIVDGATNKVYTATEKAKLAGITISGNVSGITPLEIKTVYESNSNTNAYTDAEKAKMANVPDDTNAQLADVMNDLDEHKLDYVEQVNKFNELTKIVSATNIANNSNIVSGIPGWSSIQGGQLSASNNVGTFTALAKYGRFKNTFTCVIGQVYYAKAYVKTNSNLVGISGNYIEIIKHSGSGEFEELDLLYTAQTNKKEFTIVDSRESGYDAIQFTKPLIINLTETFGSGKEPTIEEMRNMLNKFEDGWFDGTAQLVTFKEWYDNYLKLTPIINEVNSVAHIGIDELEIISTQGTLINLPKVELSEPLRYRIKGDSQEDNINKSIADTIIHSVSIAPYDGAITKTVTLPEPLTLRGISGNTRDALCWDGRVIRNVGTIEFDGTQPWTIVGADSSYTRFRYMGLSDLATPPFRSSHYPFDDTNYADIYNPYDACVRRFEKTGQIFLSFHTNTGITTVEQLNTFLANEKILGNPLTVYYQKSRYTAAKGNEPIYTEEEIAIEPIMPIEYGKLSTTVTQGTPYISIYRLGNAIPELEDLNELVDLSVIKYKAKILEVTNRAKQKQSYDTLTFGFVTDTHREANTLLAISLITEASKTIGMKYICHGGDMIDGLSPKEIELDRISRYYAIANNINTPFLFVNGNHEDNNWYARTIVGTNQLADYISPKEIYTHTLKTFEDKVVVGSKEGLYYYLDDDNSKIRTIFVNTHKIPFEANPDGTAKFNAHEYDAFGNEQLNWIGNIALNFADKTNASEWGVVIVGHMAGNDSVMDNGAFIGIVQAYKNGLSYQSSGTTLIGDYSVNVDYTTQGVGDFITLINGDMHMDAIYSLYGLKCIVTLNSSARDETCWDIFTIDRNSRTIYSTRYGTGVDRETTY